VSGELWTTLDSLGRSEDCDDEDTEASSLISTTPPLTDDLPVRLDRTLFSLVRSDTGEGRAVFLRLDVVGVDILERDVSESSPSEFHPLRP
jgi:hypothetical protein